MMVMSKRGKTAHRVNLDNPPSQGDEIKASCCGRKLIFDRVSETGTPCKAVSRTAETPPNSRGKVDVAARITGGKCAYEREGILTVVSSRSKMEPVEGSVTVAAGIGKGTQGVCPVCRSTVILTGKGYIPTHYPAGVTPPRPSLTEKTIPNLENGTPVSTEAKKQEIFSRDKAGNPVIPTAPEAGSAVGSRDHGTLDGVAMTPGNLSPIAPEKGWVAKAGTMTLPVGRNRPDREVVETVYHGNRCPCGEGRNPYAFLTCEEYWGKSDAAQHRYWKTLSRMKKRGRDRRAVIREMRQRQGLEMPWGERKRLRKEASPGSSIEGLVHGTMTHRVS